MSSHDATQDRMAGFGDDFRQFAQTSSMGQPPTRAGKDWRLMNDLLREINAALLRNPDMRLCQLIVNATLRSDPFHVEDVALLDALRNYRA